MKTKKVVRKIFDTLNYSKKLKISSILPDRDSDYAILLELEDGSKFGNYHYPNKEIRIRSGTMATNRQKEKAQTKYLSKFSDNQIH